MIRSSRPVRLVCAVLSLTACSPWRRAAAATTRSRPRPPRRSWPPLRRPPRRPRSRSRPAPTRSPGASRRATPVVAVKIDDTANGRPQVNIDKANMVYIEQVEGGLTRLVAVFDTVLPSVEPVRSMRASDPELLSQYGPIALRRLRRRRRRAAGARPLHAQGLDQRPGRARVLARPGPGQRRAGRREPEREPADGRPAACTPPAPSRSAGPGPPTRRWPAPRPPRSLRTVVGGTTVQFNWSAKLGRYVRLIDGAVQHAADGAADLDAERHRPVLPGLHQPGRRRPGRQPRSLHQVDRARQGRSSTATGTGSPAPGPGPRSAPAPC